MEASRTFSDRMRRTKPDGFGGGKTKWEEDIEMRGFKGEKQDPRLLQRR